MVLEYCTDACGWAGAFVAILGFGTFGVPIKSRAANSVNVDPLVMQTYKSTMCFLWAIVLVLVPPSYGGVPATFTPWGILSGLFWVPGGVAVVYSIRNAGLALTVGINSSLIVLVSFAWGIFVFGEQVKSRTIVALAVTMMIAGIAGMSYFSDPHRQMQPPSRVDADNLIATRTPRSLNRLSSSNTSNSMTGHDPQYTDLPQRPMPETVAVVDLVNKEEVKRNEAPTTLKVSGVEQQENVNRNQNENEDADADDEESNTHDFEPDETDSRVCRAYESPATTGHYTNPLEEVYIPILGKSFTRRQLGIMCSTFNGLWGGSIMVPMHFAPSGTGGLGYTFSFAIGAMLVTLGLWLGRWMYNYNIVRRHSSNRGNLGDLARATYHDLPSLHFKVLWWAGGWCGTFWSMANIGSMVAVQFLGEGMGYSTCQAALLVSGMWGIFWFHEIRGFAAISLWLASACVTIASLLLLSYEHIPGERR